MRGADANGVLAVDEDMDYEELWMRKTFHCTTRVYGTQREGPGEKVGGLLHAARRPGNGH